MVFVGQTRRASASKFNFLKLWGRAKSVVERKSFYLERLQTAKILSRPYIEVMPTVMRTRTCIHMLMHIKSITGEHFITNLKYNCICILSRDEVESALYNLYFSDVSLNLQLRVYKVKACSSSSVSHIYKYPNTRRIIEDNNQFHPDKRTHVLPKAT